MDGLIMPLMRRFYCYYRPQALFLERETSEFISNEIKLVLQILKQEEIRIVGVVTRWASQVALIALLIRIEETAILQLRSQKFAFKGNKLMWVWAHDWWNTLEGVHKALEPLQDIITIIQSDGMILARAVELVVPVLEKIPLDVKDVAPGDFAAAKKLVSDRKPLILRTEGLVANIFHHQCRGK